MPEYNNVHHGCVFIYRYYVLFYFSKLPDTGYCTPWLPREDFAIIHYTDIKIIIKIINLGDFELFQ